MRHAIVVVFVFLFAFVSLSVPASAGAETPSLAWLEGCWAFERDGRRYEEVWLPASSKGLLGVAQTLKDGRRVEHEFMRVDYRSDGPVEFVANPEGQASARFRRVSGDDHRAVFENPQHDFPTRIEYAYTPPDRLDAKIEGLRDGRRERLSYPYLRSRCPGS